jgi:hypothetical protein
MEAKDLAVLIMMDIVGETFQGVTYGKLKADVTRVTQEALKKLEREYQSTSNENRLRTETVTELAKGTRK